MALIAVLLTGIVFLNVALLELNGSIARMDTRAAELKRKNADLTMRVARLGSSERIQRAAAAQGFAGAAPGAVGYLRTREHDAAAAGRALERWRPPAPAGAPGERSLAGESPGSSDDRVGGSPDQAGGESTGTASGGAGSETAGPTTAATGAGTSSGSDTARALAGSTPSHYGQTGGATP